MLALRFYAPEYLRLEDVPEPTCGPDEIELRVKKLLHLRHRRQDPPGDRSRPVR